MQNHRGKSESRVRRVFRDTLVRIVIKREGYDVNLLMSGEEYIFLCLARRSTQRVDEGGESGFVVVLRWGRAYLKKTVRQSCATFNHVNGQKALSLPCKAARRLKPAFRFIRDCLPVTRPNVQRMRDDSCRVTAATRTYLIMRPDASPHALY